MIHDLSGAVARLATHTVTRRRASQPSVTDGRFAALSYTQTSALGSVQSVPGAEAERLGLGARTNDTRQVFVPLDLDLRTPTDGVPGDDVSFDGGATWWAVRHVEDWRDAAAYTRAIVERRVV